jgi:hypothetical protein
VTEDKKKMKKLASTSSKTDKFYFYFSKFLDLDNWANDLKKSEILKPHKSANNLSAPLKNNLNSFIGIENQFHSWVADDNSDAKNQSQRVCKPQYADITFWKDTRNVFLVEERRYHEILDRDLSFADMVKLA